MELLIGEILRILNLSLLREVDDNPSRYRLAVHLQGPLVHRLGRKSFAPLRVEALPDLKSSADHDRYSLTTWVPG